MTKVAVITGGSCGIGLECARELLRRGCRVYEMSRRESSESEFAHLRVDVTDEESVKAAVEKIVQQEGRIDILINNAGMGISGAVEFTGIDEAKKLFNVNFFGSALLSRTVIPYMRKSRSGRIVNISSVAAPVPIPFQAYYSASKAAVSSFSQALRTEVLPFGIEVCAVMPGDIKTGFTAARKKFHDGDEEYSGRISRSVGKMEADEKNGMSPVVAGKFIAGIALKKHVKPLYSIGFSYRLITVAAKIMPASFLNAVVAKLY